VESTSSSSRYISSNQLVLAVHQLELLQLVTLILEVVLPGLVAEPDLLQLERLLLLQVGVQLAGRPLGVLLSAGQVGLGRLLLDAVLLLGVAELLQGLAEIELGLPDLLVDRRRVEPDQDVALVDEASVINDLENQQLPAVALEPE
jgi:hypothetical protein